MFGWEHVNRVTADAELTSRKFHVVAFVLDADQVRDQVALFNLITDFTIRRDLVQYGLRSLPIP